MNCLDCLGRIEAIERAVAALQHHANPVTQCNWRLTRPRRSDALTWPIYVVLEAAFKTGRSRPTAIDVLAAFGMCKPPEVIELLSSELKYQTNDGAIRIANLAAIRGRIHRMTTVC